MQYHTYEPHADLSSIIQCYWTLEVPANPAAERQRIVPDGTIEMAFILGDDIKRYTSEQEYVIQPRAMVLGQTVKPFYIKPTGYVNTFAIRFYPFGFGHFVKVDIKELINKETPIRDLFPEEEADWLELTMSRAGGTSERIEVIEEFLLAKMREASTIDKIVSSTVSALQESHGTVAMDELLKLNQSNLRQLQRKFAKQVGLSPKQLGKVIRLQAALKLLLNKDKDTLTQIAYRTNYYDQAHFIKDFKEFTGTNPRNFLRDKQLELSALFYSDS